ncbi:MAG: MopE-related protein [Patulibacter minatonensis]
MRRPLATLLAALLCACATTTSASAATVGFADGVLTYTGVDAAESVSVESVTTGVKFYDIVSGQIASPVPSGCTSTNYSSNATQQVICSMSGLSSVTLLMGGGDDTVIANGLSKPSLIRGGAGNDTLTGGSASDTIWGDEGVDVLNSGPSVDSIYVRDGVADTVDCGGALDNLNGDTTDVFRGCESTDLSDEQVPDADGDGFKPPADCKDADPTIYPGADDIPGDGIDQDCDGRDAVAPATPTPLVTPRPPATPTPAPTNRGTTTTAKPAATPTAKAIATPTPKAGGTGGSAESTASGLLPESSVPNVQFRLLPGGAFTRATRLTVRRIPSGATLALRCKGTGCPKRTFTKTYQHGIQRLVLRAPFGTARLRAGWRVDARVTAPGRTGRSHRYTINARAMPNSEVRCLDASTSAPVGC